MLRDDIPEAISLCLDCAEPECKGACERFRAVKGSEEESPARKILEYMGEALTVQQWADRLGMNRSTIYDRLSRGLEIEDVLRQPKQNAVKATEEQINKTYVVLAGMPPSYAWFVNLNLGKDNSIGFVAKYGRFKAQRTNRINRPTETQAIKELSLTDEENNTIEWIHSVIAVIEYLYTAPFEKSTRQINKTRADILMKRAFKGYTLTRIAELLSNPRKTVSPNIVRRHYSYCVKLVAAEAVRRGLFVSP